MLHATLVVVRPVAGLRSRPRTAAELVTQEVWGRRLTPIEAKADWLLCETVDGMRGWVPASSVAPGAGFAPTHVVGRRFAAFRRGRRDVVMLPMGSTAAVESVHRGAARVRGPDGRMGRLPAGALVPVAGARPGPAEARAVMERLIPEVIGAPYLWGGKSTFGFDCSGLVQVTYGFLGVTLPRDSSEQAATGRRVESLERLRPLDLVFFGAGGRIDHVAIHLGGLVILHSSGYVRLETLEAGRPGFREDLRRRFAWATRPMA